MSKSKVFFRINLDICIEPDEGSFHSFCPGLKGIHSSGRTSEEALENCKQAAIAYTLSLLKHHEPLPFAKIVRIEQKDEACGAAEHFNENIEIPEQVPA